MDKRVIFAVAGSGKTTHIVDSLSPDKRSLIITYTLSNYENLSEKIAGKYDGMWPENVTLMTFFPFLYSFCYKPFLSDRYRARGIIYKKNPIIEATQNELRYYMTSGRYFYSNRLSLFLQNAHVVGDIKRRIETYFDEFIIDEIQDIAGRDFNLLVDLMETNTNILFVGDFYQHTYDTSRDGNVNQSLFDDRLKYEKRFSEKGVIPDLNTLVKSWRCRKSVCDFVTNNLGIVIQSHSTAIENSIHYISDPVDRSAILANPKIAKLHYRESLKHGPNRKNWGDTKGEDHYEDICVMLNKTTAKLFKQGKLTALPASTRNKLYVAITRAHGTVYLIDE